MTITLTREEAQQVLDALYSMNGTEFLCQAAHHPKKDMHKLGEVCPVAARYMAARETLRTQLAQPEPETCGYDETTGNCTQNPCCYPSPPQRKEWQELSDYDVDNIVKASSGRESAVYLAEAKLKEKNG
jgi:hypothetical protein